LNSNNLYDYIFIQKTKIFNENIYFMENILTSSCESQLVNDSVENTNTLNNENNSNQDKINDSGSVHNLIN